MPTQSTTYNSRVTDEALEKRFRDTFRSQGGAELVDDLYASGVIVPVVDFTQAATGDVLAENLQTAWDFSTGSVGINTNTPTAIISNAGFWLVDFTLSVKTAITGAINVPAVLDLYDGASAKPVWAFSSATNATATETNGFIEAKFVVFLRSGDSLRGRTQGANSYLDVWYRQIADVSGNIVNPTGFTSS